MPLPSRGPAQTSGIGLASPTMAQARQLHQQYGERLPVGVPGERFPGIVNRMGDAYFHLEDNNGVYQATALAFFRNLEVFNTVTGADYWPVPVLLRPNGQLGRLVFRDDTFIEPRLILFDVQLAGSGTNGFAELARVRAKLPNAILIIVSSVAENLHDGNEQADLADFSIDKSIDSALYTKLVLELLTFSPQIPVCGACPAYDLSKEPYRTCAAAPLAHAAMEGHVLLEPATPCPMLRYASLVAAYGPVFHAFKAKNEHPPKQLHTHVMAVKRGLRALVPASIPDAQVPAEAERMVRAGIERAFALQGTVRVSGQQVRKRGTMLLSKRRGSTAPDFFPYDAEVLVADGCQPAHASPIRPPQHIVSIRDAIRRGEVFDLDCFLRRDDFVKGWRPKE